jgi:hypothetical protein
MFPVSSWDRQSHNPIPRPRRLSQDLITGGTDHTSLIPNALLERRNPGMTGRARQRRNTMYLALVALASASTIFVPSFIAIRDRTNADWHGRS